MWQLRAATVLNLVSNPPQNTFIDYIWGYMTDQLWGRETIVMYNKHFISIFKRGIE